MQIALKNRLALLILCGVALFAIPKPTYALSDVEKDIQQAVIDVGEHRYAAIEEIASQLRTNNARREGGEWMLSWMYRGTKNYKYQPYTLERNEAGFRNYTKMLDEWVQKKPDSITARVTIALVYTEGADDIDRGNTSIQSPDERRRTAAQYRETAWNYVKKIDPKSDPYIHLIHFYYVQLQPDSHAQIEEIYKNAVRDFPDFPLYYIAFTNYLSSSRNAKSGDMAAYFQSIASLPPSEEHDMAYAFAAMYVPSNFTNAEMYKSGGMQWPLVQKGFAVIEKRYGLSEFQKNVFMSLAVGAKDRKVAEAAQKNIKHWDPAVWHVYHYYANALKWMSEKDEKKAEMYWSALPYDARHYADLWLVNDQFDLIEKVAQQFIDTDAREEGGFAMLGFLYGALGSVSENYQWHTESHSFYSFNEKQAHVAKWLEANPKSRVAHIVMARLYAAYAEAARGRSYAGAVTQQQWDDYRDRNSKAVEYLKELDPHSDPEIYLVYQMAEMANGHNSRMNLDDIYASEVKTFPSFFAYYPNRARLLEVKWGGNPGELARLVKTLPKMPGGESGLIAVSFVADYIFGLYEVPKSPFYSAADHRLQPFEFNMEEFPISWPEIKKSYALREKRYGLSNYDWNRMLEMSVQYADPAAGADAVSHIQSMDNNVWPSINMYLIASSWANGGAKRQAELAAKKH